jgi:hypothetical protein
VSAEEWVSVGAAAYGVAVVFAWVLIVWKDWAREYQGLTAMFWPVALMAVAFVIVEEAADELGDVVRNYRDNRAGYVPKKLDLFDVQFPPPPPLKDEPAEEARKQGDKK